MTGRPAATRWASGGISGPRKSAGTAQAPQVVDAERAPEQAIGGGLLGEPGEDRRQLVGRADVAWTGVAVADAQRRPAEDPRREDDERRAEARRPAVGVAEDVEGSVDGVLLEARAA